ncbi:bifunctional demethylmenaquinone methyltransferase/2-methoxy-6-polyprenyl-1,4-benzoquinol methylase UbiE [Sporohalobacter salinus]|uniref:bifunctional demethylmenaquinone methyltransferase/2-methoxy-6-polyprenyl-1,4-benzoquinol methylase UbiE n=1 Tax=Sporohalobacter salinus TaxID=1494606 RepID=UPI0019603F46|nr:bifunctional demethylmenaquinone methyltransferase/2-methoxy-6-polyprenyl-1,4-benzoquinol methylase UbiE [Sporohalobacter salinus]MBM7623075.1 demethylmenaquinone methyltransferase/2-methoxy-6-polyprenyl-1,4-benzoquinol methylase [Sporohalobacter salinus]
MNYKNKEKLVYDIFQSIASKYDLINKFMSFGLDNHWRRCVAKRADLKPGDKVLDVGGGTGRLSLELAKLLDDSGSVVCTDFSENMLKKAKKDLKEHRCYNQIEFKFDDAMNLSFVDNTFDVVTSAWVLRNVEDISQVLVEMQRVVKPEGKVVSLDLAKPKSELFKKGYSFYLYRIIPLIGSFIYGQSDPYEYLYDSWKRFPSQDELAEKFKKAGLINVDYYELIGGAIAVHVGQKPH